MRQKVDNNETKTKWQQYQNETVTRERQDSISVSDAWIIILTTLSDKSAVTHQRYSDTDSWETDKDAEATYNSETMIYI